MMMRKIIASTLLMLLISTGYSQEKEKIKGSREVTIKESKINDFNRIVVGEDFKIDLIEGSSPSVFIEADDNLHDVINYSVSDSTLYFNTIMKITSSKKINIKVSHTKSLRHIETIEDGEVSSLTSINVDGIVLVNSGSSRAFLNIKAPKFKLINSDRAKVKLNVTTRQATLEINDNAKTEALIQADSMRIDIYQRADADIEGSANYLNIRADNSANFVGKNLVVAQCDVLSDLNSDVYVHVTDRIKIQAIGNSEVYIYNDPKIELDQFKDTAKLHKKELKN